MKLLVVSAYFETHRGGVEIVAGQLSRALAGRGFEVRWLASDASATPEGEGIRTQALPAFNGLERRTGLPVPIPYPSAFAAIHRAVRASDVVLIHDTLYLNSICAFVSARLHRKPVIVVQHVGRALFGQPVVQRVVRAAELWLTRPMLGGADQAVFISDSVAACFKGVKLRRPAMVSYSGVDVDIFRPPAGPEEKRSLRRRHDFKPERPVLLYAGRFIDNKGLPTLRALAQARPDLDLALAGWGPVEPETWRLPNVRVFRGLAGESLAQLYRSADAFVLASPSEGFSLVVREALASGLPVVCGDLIASTDPDIADHILTVPIDTEAAAVTVSHFSRAADRALAEPSGAAVEFVRRRYGWDRIGRLYADLAISLSSRGSVAQPLGQAA